MTTPERPHALVFATGNAHKITELEAILAPLVPGFTAGSIASMGDFGVPEPVEDGVTFEENALIKARAVAQATGLPAVADDSGICVDVMGGAPGIFSARWCGRHGDDAANLDLLIAQLADVPHPHRGAAFTCAAALVLPDGREFVRLGQMRGSLLDGRRGHHGFGYDPIFVPDGSTLTTAEMDAAEKNAMSHRAKAFTELAPTLQAMVFARRA